jgi:hypothetical protein
MSHHPTPPPLALAPLRVQIQGRAGRFQVCCDAETAEVDATDALRPHCTCISTQEAPYPGTPGGECTHIRLLRNCGFLSPRA